MKQKTHALCYVAALLTLVNFAQVGANQITNSPVSTCEVTHPNGRGTFREQPSPVLHGNGALSVGLWPDGTVVFKPGGSGFVMTDGSLGMKFGWRRGVRGQLTIEGYRLDAAAPALRANIPCCYGDIGFQSTALIFPTPGCWEVTGHVGDSNLTFVTRVVKIGDGPVHFEPALR